MSISQYLKNMYKAFTKKKIFQNLFSIDFNVFTAQYWCRINLGHKIIIIIIKRNKKGMLTQKVLTHLLS